MEKFPSLQDSERKNGLFQGYHHSNLGMCISLTLFSLLILTFGWTDFKLKMQKLNGKIHSNETSGRRKIRLLVHYKFKLTKNNLINGKYEKNRRNIFFYSCLEMTFLSGKLAI